MWRVVKGCFESKTIRSATRCRYNDAARGSVRGGDSYTRWRTHGYPDFVWRTDGNGCAYPHADA